MSFLSHGEYVPLQANSYGIGIRIPRNRPTISEREGMVGQAEGRTIPDGTEIPAQLSKLMGDAVEIKKENKQILVRRSD